MDHMPITYIYFWLKHIKEITKQVQTAPFQMVQSLNYFFSQKCYWQLLIQNVIIYILKNCFESTKRTGLKGQTAFQSCF